MAFLFMTYLAFTCIRMAISAPLIKNVSWIIFLEEYLTCIGKILQCLVVNAVPIGSEEVAVNFTSGNTVQRVACLQASFSTNSCNVFPLFCNIPKCWKAKITEDTRKLLGIIRNILLIQLQDHIELLYFLTAGIHDSITLFL